MPEPKHKVGDIVEVNISANTDLPEVWVRAIVKGVATQSKGYKFTEPIYTTTNGTLHEKYIRPVKKEGK